MCIHPIPSLHQVHFILIGQCDEDLQATADSVAAIRPTTVTSDIKVSDLTDPEALVTALTRTLVLLLYPAVCIDVLAR
mgnify:CR=1 FL=1